MNHISNLSDIELHNEILAKAQKERELTVEVIHLLREVERRRLFAKRGCSSLHEYCVFILKYSEGAAQRRIQAMRLIKDLPLAEEKILTGELNLTTLSTVQVFFNAQAKQEKPLSLESKLELVESFEGKSKRDIEKVLYTIAPQALSKEKERVVSDSLEVKFYVDPELQQDLERLRELLAHKNPNYSYAELIQELATIALKQLDPEVKAHVKGRQKFKKQSVTPPALPKTPERNSEISIKPEPSDPEVIPPFKSKASVRRYVFQRDHGACQFTDPLTQKKCLSRFKIQLEHIRPKALGGNDDPSNLELLCATHNQLRAIEVFGQRKMGEYLRF